MFRQPESDNALILIFLDCLENAARGIFPLVKWYEDARAFCEPKPEGAA